MSKTKSELQEELELLRSQLSAAQAEIEEVRAEARKVIKSAKSKAKRQADSIEEARAEVYEEAKASYNQAVATAKEIKKDLQGQVADNLGLVARSVRSEVLHILNVVFGDEL